MAERRMPLRKVRVELDGDYAGWWAEGRANISPTVVLELNRATTTFIETEVPTLKLNEEFHQKVFAFLEAVLLPNGEWNFVDTEGKPIELSADSIRKALPSDLLAELRNQFLLAIIEVPKA